VSPAPAVAAPPPVTAPTTASPGASWTPNLPPMRRPVELDSEELDVPDFLK
jgi:hypothetical protein